MSILQALENADKKVREWSEGRIGEELPSVIAEREAKKESERQAAISKIDQTWKDEWAQNMQETEGMRNVELAEPITSKEITQQSESVAKAINAIKARVETKKRELYNSNNAKNPNERNLDLDTMIGASATAKHQIAEAYNQNPTGYMRDVRPGAEIYGLMERVGNRFQNIVEENLKAPGGAALAARAGVSTAGGESLKGKTQDIMDRQLGVARERAFLLDEGSDIAIVNQLAGWEVVKSTLAEKLKKAGMQTERGPRQMNDIEIAYAVDKREAELLEELAQKMAGKLSDPTKPDENTLTIQTLGNIGRVVRAGNTLHDQVDLADALGVANVFLQRIVASQRPIEPTLPQDGSGRSSLFNRLKH